MLYQAMFYHLEKYNVKSPKSLLNIETINTLLKISVNKTRKISLIPTMVMIYFQQNK